MFNCSIYTKIMQNSAIQQINEYLATFKDNYKYINISPEEYANLSFELHNYELQFSNNATNYCFVQIIETYKEILLTLSKYSDTRNELSLAESQIEVFRLDSVILNDVAKIKEYLKEMKQANNLFGVVHVTNVESVIINPIYAKYHELYGYPENFIYDPEKLALVKEFLGN